MVRNSVNSVLRLNQNIFLSLGTEGIDEGTSFLTKYLEWDIEITVCTGQHFVTYQHVSTSFFAFPMQLEKQDVIFIYSMLGEIQVIATDRP